MKKRLIKWFSFNLLFALTPLGAAITIRDLAGKLNFQTMQDNLHEILFFALLVSVTTLGDLDSEIAGKMDQSTLLYGLKTFLMFGATWSSLLYGAYLFDIIIGVNVTGFRLNLLYTAVTLAVVLFIVSTTTQVFLAKLISENGG